MQAVHFKVSSSFKTSFPERAGFVNNWGSMLMFMKIKKLQSRNSLKIAMRSALAISNIHIM